MTKMTENKQSTLRRIYEICLAGLTIEVGLLFIVQVWALFSMGDKAFSRTSVAEHFAPIAPFFYVWLAGVVGGAVIWELFPEQKRVTLPIISPTLTLKKLSTRLPGNSQSKLQTKRVVVAVACAIVAVVCTVVAVLYLTGDYAGKAQSGFFAEHNEAERLLRALPWFLGGVCALGFASFYQKQSVEKEIALVKAELVENAKKGVKAEKREQKPTFIENICDKIPLFKSKWFMIGLRAGLGVLAIVLIIVGILGGGMADVLEKAINICTQCIGLG